jgi:hypothetical protein
LWKLKIEPSLRQMQTYFGKLPATGLTRRRRRGKRRSREKLEE